MKPIAYVDSKFGGEAFRAVLLPTGWAVPDHPESSIPSWLDRVTLRREWPISEPDTYAAAARLAARLLGGKATVLRKPRTRPGWIH